jgi:hypothetical protein
MENNYVVFYIEIDSDKKQHIKSMNIPFNLKQEYEDFILSIGGGVPFEHELNYWYEKFKE